MIFIKYQKSPAFKGKILKIKKFETCFLMLLCSCSGG